MFPVPLKFFSEKFLTLRISGRDMIENVYCFYVNYPLFLSHFNETRISRQIFEKQLGIKFHYNPCSWQQSSTRTNRRTGRHEGANSRLVLRTRLKTNLLLLCRRIIALCSEFHTKHINTLCLQNTELLSVKPGGTYTDHSALNALIYIPHNFGPHRAVNTLHVGYKNQSGNAA